MPIPTKLTPRIVAFTTVALCATMTLVGAQTVSRAAFAVPVVFPHGIDASRVRAGDTVTAKTMQKVMLPERGELPMGMTVEGRVTTAEPYKFDPTPYATQRPSVLGLRFDQITTPHGPIHVVASLRALSAWSDSDDAKRPRAFDEHDTVGTIFMIGGGSYRGDAKSVRDEDGNVIAYIRRDGVFARLLPSQYTTRSSRLDCPGSGEREESVAIFSPRACGVYGMRDVYLTDNGVGNNPGAIRLESRARSVRLDARTTALLQVVATP